VVKTLFDPACGTGGMLAVAEDRLRALNPQAHLEVYGQELNDESYAMCRSDMMLKGETSANIRPGNSFSRDAFAGQRFDYMLANQPFGVEWKKVRSAVTDEARKLGFHGRFGAGLPRINDGSLLFLQHMISNRMPIEDGGSRLAIVFNGSPLFTGAAGSGESEIRRWIVENDWLEAVVALPDQLSTTPASRPTSGSSPTASAPSAGDWYSSSTPVRAGRRCRRAWATSASASRPTRSTRSWRCTAASPRASGCSAAWTPTAASSRRSFDDATFAADLQASYGRDVYAVLTAD